MLSATFAPLMAINIIPVEEINELHTFFDKNAGAIPLTLILTRAETINNVEWLVNQCFEILSDATVSLRIQHMRVNLLKRIKAAMETPVVVE